MKNLHYLCHILLFLLLLGCKTSKNNKVVFIEKDLQQLLDTSVNDKNMGILLHVESPSQGISWSGAAGYSDVKKYTKIIDNQCFRIASVTKTFVACSILRLWEENKLSLDDPISKYISKTHFEILKKGTYDPDKITINHLLTHSSGLFDHTNAKQYFEKIQADPSHVWTRKEQLEALVNWGKPVANVGEKFSYSDTGYILLGEIIENITGFSLNEAFVNLLFFKQLGLKHTKIEDALNPNTNPSNRIHQYFDGEDTYNWNCSIDLYGGGGLLSTTQDLALFYQGLFHHKVFKNKNTLDTMLTKTTYSSTEKPVIDYRKGIYLIKLKDYDAWTHSGYWGTQVVYIPSLNITMATNYSNGWQVRGQAPVFEKAIDILQGEKIH